MFDLSTQGLQVLLAKDVDEQHPLVQILRNSLSIPPIQIKDPVFQLRALRQRKHDVFHDEVV